MAFSARSCLGIAAAAHAVAGATGLALEPRRLGLRGRPLAQRRVNVRLYNAASDEGFPTVLPASGGNATQQDGALSATSTRPSVTATLAEPAADESEWTELILGAVNTTAATAERVLKDITAALGSKPEPPPPKPKPWWKGGGVGGGGSSGNNAAQQQQRKAKPDPAAAKARAPRNLRPTARGGANKAAPAPAKKEGFTLPWAAPKPEPEPEPRGAFDWLLRRGSAPAPAPPPPPPPPRPYRDPMERASALFEDLKRNGASAPPLRLPLSLSLSLSLSLTPFASQDPPSGRSPAQRRPRTRRCTAAGTAGASAATCRRRPSRRRRGKRPPTPLAKPWRVRRLS